MSRRMSADMQIGPNGGKIFYNHLLDGGWVDHREESFILYHTDSVPFSLEWTGWGVADLW